MNSLDQIRSGVHNSTPPITWIKHQLKLPQCSRNSITLVHLPRVVGPTKTTPNNARNSRLNREWGRERREFSPRWLNRDWVGITFPILTLYIYIYFNNQSFSNVGILFFSKASPPKPINISSDRESVLIYPFSLSCSYLFLVSPKMFN